MPRSRLVNRSGVTYRSPVGGALITSADRTWLRRAVGLAVDNVAKGGGPFAALVVSAGQIVGRGANRVTRDHDPTAHAEIVAIRAAGRRRRDFRLTGCVLVSSCEPCPMCIGAALWSHVDRVVYAADRDDAAAGGFDDREFYELFDLPRSGWRVPVRRVAIADPTRPFAAWSAKPDRIDY